MKIIWKIFLRDIKKISKSPFAIVVLIGIIIIPSLYAWFNIAACWDPYSNTNGLDVAVVNLDEGTSLGSVPVHVGDMIISKLSTNDKIGWHFVDEENGMAGVKDGTYYATVVIPKDFSVQIISVASEDITRPSIDYYINEKKNAIAPKITDKAIETIQTEVDTTFVETVSSEFLGIMNSTITEYRSKATQIIQDAVDKLNRTKADLNDFRVSINAVNTSISAVDTLIGASEQSLPNATTIMNDAIQTAESVKTLTESARSLSKELTSSISNSLSASATTLAKVDGTVASALSIADSDIKTAITQLNSARTYCDTVSGYNSNIVTVLYNLNDTLPKPLDGIKKIITQLNNTNTNISKLSTGIETAIANIQKNSSDISSEISGVRGDVKNAETALKNSTTDYQNSVAPKLDIMLGNIYNSVDSLVSALNNGKKSVPNIKSTLESVRTALRQTKVALAGVKTLTRDADTTIDELIGDINKIKSNDIIEKAIELVEKHPDKIAEFMSSPVEVKRNDLYHVANYGSAMAPFYTVLCLWVGAIVLVAILKTNVKVDAIIPRFTPTQEYFGRYIIFFFASIFQAIIVCVGDLLLLGIQCDNIPLFIFTGIVTSIIFSLIVYTLTISFGAVGKAISVLFLVLQVAGAGGTFPIEVLPDFFQKLNPLMPFTHAINAMRETVAGLYGHAYWRYMGKLLIFLPIALFVGLLLRKPLIRLNHFLEKKMESTDVMG